jgi:phosphotransferase system HPr (HPr) family protein
VPNSAGLHARPAAVLANLAKRFQSTIKLLLGDRQANARSVTAIMALEVGAGAKVQVVANGLDAAAAVETLALPRRRNAALVTASFGQDLKFAQFSAWTSSFLESTPAPHMPSARGRPSGSKPDIPAI